MISWVKTGTKIKNENYHRDEIKKQKTSKFGIKTNI